MEISAAQVKSLRETTGAGMMDCKKALVAVNGDIEKAIDEMRRRGIAKADNKSDRVTAEGIIVIDQSDDRKKAVMLEVNSETDFVARDENLKNFTQKVAVFALENNIADLDKLLASQIDGVTVEDLRKALIAKIGENIQIRRITLIVTDGVLGTYVHGGRIGVVTELDSHKPELAKDLALHIAASNPIVVNREQVPVELVNKEKEIFSAQARESGKPAEIIEKMIEGRINKFLDEVALVGQPFVKDPNTKVSQLLKAENALVKQFIRFVVGEGIEKKEDNFVEEVMSQVRSKQ